MTTRTAMTTGPATRSQTFLPLPAPRAVSSVREVQPRDSGQSCPMRPEYVESDLGDKKSRHAGPDPERHPSGVYPSNMAKLETLGADEPTLEHLIATVDEAPSLESLYAIHAESARPGTARGRASPTPTTPCRRRSSKRSCTGARSPATTTRSPGSAGSRSTGATTGGVPAGARRAGRAHRRDHAAAGSWQSSPTTT